MIAAVKVSRPWVLVQPSALGGGALAVAAAEPVQAMRYLRPLMKTP